MQINSNSLLLLKYKFLPVWYVFMYGIAPKSTLPCQNANASPPGNPGFKQLNISLLHHFIVKRKNNRKMPTLYLALLWKFDFRVVSISSSNSQQESKYGCFLKYWTVPLILLQGHNGQTVFLFKDYPLSLQQHIYKYTDNSTTIMDLSTIFTSNVNIQDIMIIHVMIEY